MTAGNEPQEKMNKRTGKQQRQQRYTAAGSVPRDHGTTLTYHKPLRELTPDEALAWIEDLKNRLSQKMQRERNYLDRRSARGTHTTTDDAYEADQVLEQEIMGLLEAVEQNINETLEDEALHQVLQRRPAQEEAHGNL
jgi:hypothetical protein